LVSEGKTSQKHSNIKEEHQIFKRAHICHGVSGGYLSHAPSKILLIVTFYTIPANYAVEPIHDLVPAIYAAAPEMKNHLSMLGSIGAGAMFSFCGIGGSC